MKVGEGLHRVILAHLQLRKFDLAKATLLYSVGANYSLAAVAGVLTLIVVGPQPLRLVAARWG